MKINKVNNKEDWPSHLLIKNEMYYVKYSCQSVEKLAKIT